MEIVGRFLIAVAVLGVLVFVHELGHFLAAKFFRIGVVEFAIGFGKKIWSRKIGETRYSLRLVPLGGFVRMIGDDPHALISDEPLKTPEELTEEEKRFAADRSRWFLTKGYWPKFWVVFAGPFFNLIFAVILCIGSLLFLGEVVPDNKATIGGVIAGHPAERAGLQEGDQVISIDGIPVQDWKDLATRVSESGGKELALLIERPILDASENVSSRTPVTIHVAGEIDSSELALLDDPDAPKRYRIGIGPSFHREPVSVKDAVQGGFIQVYAVSSMTIRGLVAMFQGAISPKHIGGPIFIFQQAAQSAKKGAGTLVNFMVLLSVSLAVLNLLPIPILDGGHILFFTIEALIRKPINIRVYEIANQVGMLVLLGLMVVAFGNDIGRVFQLQ